MVIIFQREQFTCLIPHHVVQQEFIFRKRKRSPTENVKYQYLKAASGVGSCDRSNERFLLNTNTHLRICDRATFCVAKRGAQCEFGTS